MSPQHAVDWQQVLGEARAAFGVPPRRFGWLRRLALRLSRPRWYPAGEHFPALDQILASQQLLWQRGEVVWGAILQASEGLFQPGIDDLPAVVLYSWDEQCERNVVGLAQVAQQLVGMIDNVNLADPQQREHLRARSSSEAVTPPGLLPILGHEPQESVSPRARLQAELAAPTRYEVPLALTSMVPMLATTILVRRLHLPQRRITNGYAPLVVDRVTGAATILPARYWPRDVLADWQ